MPELTDWLNSINKTKEDLLSDDDAGISEKEYLPYIINRCLSYFPDIIFIINELNKRPDMDKKMQYHFLLHMLEKKNRFSPWQKKDKIDDLELIKKHYKYNNRTAKEALEVITDSELQKLKNYIESGTSSDVVINNKKKKTHTRKK